MKIGDKFSKKEAKYKPLGTVKKRCGNCLLWERSWGFSKPYLCMIVKGDIDAQAVCKYWESGK